MGFIFEFNTKIDLATGFEFFLNRLDLFQRLYENHSPVACLNELLMLDYGEVSLQCKIR